MRRSGSIGIGLGFQRGPASLRPGSPFGPAWAATLSVGTEVDRPKPGASCPEIYRKFLEKFSALGFDPISFVAHGIGLHLHEEPYMGRYGNEIVEAGMVGAFEPLVYIPGRFGMQNKDMFAVSELGCELLSDDTPTDNLLRVG